MDWKKTVTDLLRVKNVLEKKHGRRRHKENIDCGHEKSRETIGYMHIGGRIT